MFISQSMKEVWKANGGDIRRYGEDAAAQFAVMNAVRGNVMAAFDALTEKAENVLDSQQITYSFEIVWSLLTQEHERLLAELEAAKTDSNNV